MFLLSPPFSPCFSVNHPPPPPELSPVITLFALSPFLSHVEYSLHSAPLLLLTGTPLLSLSLLLSHCRLFTAFHIFFNLPRSASLCLIAFLSRLLYQIRFRTKLWRIRIREAHKHMYPTSVADPGCLSRIPDPDFYPSRIPDPGSKNSNKREGWKKICYIFLCSHKFHKTANYFSFEVLKKKIGPFFKEL